jgi:hypothetical protein
MPGPRVYAACRQGGWVQVITHGHASSSRRTRLARAVTQNSIAGVPSGKVVRPIFGPPRCSLRVRMNPNELAEFCRPMTGEGPTHQHLLADRLNQNAIAMWSHSAQSLRYSSVRPFACSGNPTSETGVRQSLVAHLEARLRRRTQIPAKHPF